MTQANATRIITERLTVERIVVERCIEVAEGPWPQEPPSHGRHSASARTLVTQKPGTRPKRLVLPPRDRSDDP